jgi:hypothetical protein
MEKLTVKQFAEKFSISKQAIYKRIKKKTVEVELIDGVQYILVEKSQTYSSQNKKEDGGGEFFSFLLSENEQLKKDLRKKDHEIKEKNDKIEAIYQQVITVQNRNIALQDENRLLIEDTSTHPINKGVIVEHNPRSEPIREQKHKNKKKKKDKKKSKGEGLKSVDVEEMWVKKKKKEKKGKKK